MKKIMIAATLGFVKVVLFIIAPVLSLLNLEASVSWQSDPEF